MSIVSNISIPFTVGFTSSPTSKSAGLSHSLVSNVPLYNLSSRGNTCGESCAPAAFIHGRKNTYRQLAPVVLFLQSGNKPSRKATKFKKLKSINRVDTWNCNLCYHRLPPAHFYSTPTQGYRRKSWKRSPSFFFFFFFIEFYSIHKT